MRNTSGTTFGAVAAWSLLVALVALDMAMPPGTVALGALFALPPLVACAVLSPRRTALFAAAAVVATLGSWIWNPATSTAQYAVRIGNVALISGAAVVIASVRVRQARRVGRLTALAEIAQRAVLPVVPAHARRTDIAVRYASATKDTVIGGDLYDCYHSRSHTRFLIGDVRGKGIGAVEQTARVIRAFRQAAAIQTELSAVAADMSSYLYPFFDEEEFVTALLLDTTDAKRARLVNAGHPPPLLVRGDGSYEFLERDADLPLGLGRDYSCHQFDWEHGDRLLMYTDGVSEARDTSGTFLDLAPLAGMIASTPLQATLDLLLERVRQHSAQGELGDDVAMILLEHTVHGQEYRSTTGDHDWLTLLTDSDAGTTAPTTTEASGKPGEAGPPPTGASPKTTQRA